MLSVFNYLRLCFRASCKAFKARFRVLIFGLRIFRRALATSILSVIIRSPICLNLSKKGRVPKTNLAILYLQVVSIYLKRLFIKLSSYLSVCWARFKSRFINGPKYCPVYDFFVLAIFSGVPATKILPPP